MVADKSNTKLSLTQKQLDALKPSDKRREIADGGGLYFIIQPSGARSWAVRYRHNGRLLKLTLGQFPRINLADARKQARKALAAVDSGRDPQAEKVAARRAARADDRQDRIETIVETFLQGHAKRKLRPNSQKEAERILKGRFVARWKGRRLSEISKRDIRGLLDEIIAEGHGVMANRALSWFRLFCNWALEREIIGANPCAGIRAPADEQPRERVLSAGELLAIWKAAEGVSGPAGRMIRLLILTGQRLREAGQMRWPEVDLTAPTWTLPGERAKNGRSHVIPLAPAAVEILENAPLFEGGDAVFTNDGAKPIAGFSAIKARIDKLLPDDMVAWTFHDLRRSFASGCAGLGVPIHVVEKLLNHVSGSFGGIVGVYQKFDFAGEQRAAVEAWARHIEQLNGGAGAENVVALRGARPA